MNNQVFQWFTYQTYPICEQKLEITEEHTKKLLCIIFKSPNLALHLQRRDFYSEGYNRKFDDAAASLNAGESVMTGGADEAAGESFTFCSLSPRSTCLTQNKPKDTLSGNVRLYVTSSAVQNKNNNIRSEWRKRRNHAAGAWT